MDRKWVSDRLLIRLAIRGQSGRENRRRESPWDAPLKKPVPLLKNILTTKF